MRRPLIAVALLYIAGILLGGLPVPLTPLFAVAFTIAILCLLVAKSRLVLLASLIVLTGWINTAQRTAIVSPNDLRVRLGDQPESVAVRGKLCETPVRHV